MVTTALLYEAAKRARPGPVLISFHHNWIVIQHESDHTVQYEREVALSGYGVNKDNMSNTGKAAAWRISFLVACCLEV